MERPSSDPPPPPVRRSQRSTAGRPANKYGDWETRSSSSSIPSSSMSTRERRLAEASRQKQAADDELRRKELDILRMELELERNINEREHQEQLAKIEQDERVDFLLAPPLASDPNERIQEWLVEGLTSAAQPQQATLEAAMQLPLPDSDIESRPDVTRYVKPPTQLAHTSPTQHLVVQPQHAQLQVPLPSWPMLSHTLASPSEVTNSNCGQIKVNYASAQTNPMAMAMCTQQSHVTLSTRPHAPAPHHLAHPPAAVSSAHTTQPVTMVMHSASYAGRHSSAPAAPQHNKPVGAPTAAPSIHPTASSCPHPDIGVTGTPKHPTPAICPGTVAYGRDRASAGPTATGTTNSVQWANHQPGNTTTGRHARGHNDTAACTQLRYLHRPKRRWTSSIFRWYSSRMAGLHSDLRVQHEYLQLH